MFPTGILRLTLHNFFIRFTRLCFRTLMITKLNPNYEKIFTRHLYYREEYWSYDAFPFDLVYLRCASRDCGLW